MNRIYLVRHGENLANLTREFSHHSIDYSLTPKGVLQAQQTAAFFQSARVDEVYSSPLRRAFETAQIIAKSHALPVQTLENFREVNVGDLEGQPPTDEAWDFHNSVINGWLDGKPEVRFPGGENFSELVERIHAGIRQVLQGKNGRSIIIVAHGGIVSFTLPYLCANVTREDLRGKLLANCSITEIEAQVVGDQIEAQMIRFGAWGHLSGEAAQLVSGLPTRIEQEEGLHYGETSE